MCDLRIPYQTVPFRYGLPKKRPPVLIWTKKTFFEDFYIKSLNWKRKRSNSNFQVKCIYQTTTNIAFSCKMVRVSFLLSMILEFPHQTVPFRYGLTKKRLGQVLIWTKRSFFEDFYIKVCNWKRKGSNSNFKVYKWEYWTTTNIAFLCNMLRVPFLLCAL